MTAGGGVDAFGSWPPGTAPSVADLRQHLIVTRIAGDVATTRENNLRNFGLMSARDPGYLFGLRPRGPWTPPDVLALMHQRVGVQADPVHAEGQDTIDPDRTIDRLDAMAERLRLAVERRQRPPAALRAHDGVPAAPHLLGAARKRSAEPLEAEESRPASLPQLRPVGEPRLIGCLVTGRGQEVAVRKLDVRPDRRPP